jgi:preprotein translocase subunit Sss1
MREVAKLSAFILLIIGTIGFLVNEFFLTGVKLLL